MGGCSKWTYSNITPKVFQSLQSLGKKQGFTIPSAPSGKFVIETAGMKIGFQYAWKKNSGILLLQCIHKPPIGCKAIKGIADKIITNCGGKT